MKPAFEINGHDYAPYVKHKTGLAWSRENTNDEDAGRDKAETMHTLVTSHQRKLEVKMGPMPFEKAQQLEKTCRVTTMESRSNTRTLRTGCVQGCSTILLSMPPSNNLPMTTLLLTI